MKDHYQTLELAPFASETAVKAAFRRLARQYHPDLFLHAPERRDEAEERFKAINEAYEILGDPVRKRQFDAALKQHRGVEPPPPSPAAPPPTPEVRPRAKAPPPPPTVEDTRQSPSSTPVTELFERFFHGGQSGGGTSSGGRSGFHRGPDATVDTLISPMEAAQGTVKTVSVEHRDPCRRCSGTGRLNGLVCPGCQGEKVFVRLKKLDVRIPAGVRTGSKVRVTGEGGRGSSGADHGDLYLLIRVGRDPSLRVEGLNVFSDLEIPVLDAVLGCTLNVPTLHGPVQMTVPALTSSGRVFRLRHQGARSGSSTGDQFVTVHLVTPASLSAKEESLYRELARLREPDTAASQSPRR